MPDLRIIPETIAGTSTPDDAALQAHKDTTVGYARKGTLMQKPTPKPIVVTLFGKTDTESFIAIWVSTPALACIIEREAPTFGVLEWQPAVRRYHLAVPPTYQSEEVADYLRSLTDLSS